MTQLGKLILLKFLSILVFKLDKFLIVGEVIIEAQCGALVLTSAAICTTAGRSK
jgi:hypothetical protein